jgi:hypothetical protein
MNKMETKYTAIFTEHWMAGSHMQTLVHMKRVELQEDETVADMLKREDILDTTQYLLVGHPPLQGE